MISKIIEAPLNLCWKYPVTFWSLAGIFSFIGKINTQQYFYEIQYSQFIEQRRQEIDSIGKKKKQ